MRVFVTRELFPFTHGGIGRSIANMLSVSTEAELNSTAIVWVGDEFDTGSFAMLYPKVRLVIASRQNYSLSDRDGTSYPPEWAFTDSEWHWHSVRAMQGLRRLADEVGQLDYVEFHDWGGLGFASIQEKLLGSAFQDTVLAVRLHTADSLLADVDNRPADKQTLVVFDLERKALADCDLIVAQLPEVAKAIQTFFSFSDEAWSQRLYLHASPVLLDAGTVATRSIEPSLDVNIVFSSKIQHLKRPELFIRGCCGFLRATPDYRGSVILAAHATDPQFLARIRRMIPENLKSRFSFLNDLSVTERHAVVSRAVCVTASSFESFCLSAYEASLAGSISVLNGSNPAFGENSPWIDDVNCVKFDGSAESLAAALVRAVKGGAREVVRVPETPAPWTAGMRGRGSARTNQATRPLVSVIVPHFNLGDYLLRTVDSVLASTYENVEIIVIDDCSTDGFSRLTIERLEGVHERLRIVRNTMNLGLAATRNAGLAHVRGDYVLTLDADDLIGPGFIELSVRALENQLDYDFVVPQTGFFHDSEESQIGQQVAFADYAVFYGEARAVGTFENRFSTATCMTRTRVLRELRYREELEAYEDWDFYMRAVMAGKRFIVTSGIHFFYRRRSESMFHSPERLARHRTLYHDLLRKKSFKLGQAQLPLYVVEAGASPSGDAEALQEELHAARARLAYFERSRAVFIAVRLNEKLRRVAPWAVFALSMGTRVARAVRRRLRV
ncbi:MULTISPECIES: glycosyltransferase [unclassified Caballeronia]|uniref:glycosyltransferase n=1 Tax=unclassified Caballeronia TaxID=2646786 RepID=UPI002028E57F|nr:MULTISPECIES: glycosyltransferase [unclassified Caballeronia]